MGVNGALGGETGFPTTGLARLESYLVEFRDEFDLRGKVEVRADSGLTLLYGRNGSGKTSILRTIKSTLAGIAPDSLESPICHLVVTLSDWDSEDPSYLSRKEFQGCSGFIHNLSRSVLQHQGFEHGWSESEYRVEFEKWATELTDIDPQLAELPLGWLSFASEGRGGDPTEDVYQECVRFLTKSRARLLAVPLIEDSIFMSFVGSLKKGSERFQRTVETIRHTLTDPVLVVSPDGSPEDPQWTVSIAVRNPGPDSDFGSLLEAQEQALSNFVEEHGLSIFSEIEAFELDALPTALLRGNPINSAWGTKYYSLHTTSQPKVSELPFVLIDANSVRSINECLNAELSGNFPTVAAAWSAALQLGPAEADVVETDLVGDELDESEDEDVESSPEMRLAEGPFGPIDLDDPSLEENVEHIRRFLRDLQMALSLLGNCDIRISSGTHLQLRSSLEDIREGRFIDVSFYEFPSLQGPFSVSFEQLSDGQRKLINLAFAAVSASSDDTGKTVILVGDEIDNGIHVRAVIALYRMLGGLPLSSLCSTHSIDAVAHSVGRRVCLTRDDQTGIHVGGFDVKDAKVAAERLGVTTSSLLAFFRVIVIVEGEHDRIVFESLFDAQDMNLGNEIVVIPIRGANNLMTSLEAEFLDYTDARILVVLDNVRLSTIAKIREAARPSGNGNSRDRRNALLAARGRCQSHEERIIGDVIIRRFDRGDLSRFSLFGLSKRDVIEYLNPRDFGIADWDEVRQQHDSLPISDPLARTSFKDYLRATQRISISNEDVKRASRNLDAVHPDLVAAIEQAKKQLNGRVFELGFGISDA